MAEINVSISETLTVRGFLSAQNVANFLGISFASIPARFRLAQPVNLESQKGIISATEYGPICPQPVDVPRQQRDHLYAGVRPSSTFSRSEFDCLNLNVYTPPRNTNTSKLPVFVWIHGGGWTVGDGNSEYDGNFLVEQSIVLNRPFVYVALNYRLGYYGFCHSKELKQEAARHGETYYANQGLHDQRLGLQWVQKHIHHFGGDPSNVTIAGESAGAWCVLAHLLSDVPVCQRGIVMSGPCFVFPEEQVSQRTFDRLIASTGVSDSSPEEKIAALQKLPDEAMESLLQGAFARPSWDPKWFSSLGAAPGFVADFENFPSWVQGLLIGATKDESALFCQHTLSWSAVEVKGAVRSVFPSGQGLAEEVQSTYGLQYSEDDAIAVQALLRLATDSVFAPLPYIIAEKTLNVPVYVYLFSQVDVSLSSVFRGYSYHSLDNVFVCRLPAVAGPQASPDLRATADSMTSAFCDFVYGQEPWEPFQDGSRIMRFDGERSSIVEFDKREQLWRGFMTKDSMNKLFAAGMKLITLKRVV